MKTDLSREIFEQYYHSNGKILKITLKNKAVLYGLFTGFYHGDQEAGEPFIIRWSFVPEEEAGSMADVRTAGRQTRIVPQDEIESVTFK